MISSSRLFFFVLLCLYFNAQSITYAQTEDSYQTSLDNVTKEIQNISRSLNANKTRLLKEESGLLDIERKIHKLAKSINEFKAKIRIAKAELAALKIQQEELANKQTQSRLSLANLIQSNHKNGITNQLKTMLNQENPYAVGRLSNYRSYFALAIEQRFNELEEQLMASNQVAEERRKQILELQSLEQEQNFLMQTQEKQSESRKLAVKKLNAKVVSNESKLEKLKQDRSRLNSLLKTLQKRKLELAEIQRKRRAAELKALEESKVKETPKKKPRKLVKGGFSKQKGRLSCPLDQAPRTRFGERLVSSGMKSEGVFYETGVSTPVRSIFRGQVLFSDFLKGFGLLIIVDHGDNHISLYGHNEVLYKKVGDTIITNEIISKSGMTGGLKSPGLYFEIRNNTAPINPSIWCK
ncbi:murein hydrolase activator EnvC [Arenicella sp. 4NH20-0111]|uniref:murein hydrolase activator EnvC family protein n=1 Tax=Arenicella sp. 4NH20-0111 TaxID=3127648 RepID=UPI003105FD25